MLYEITYDPEQESKDVLLEFNTELVCQQNFFRDPWNTFDFVTVIGSIVDALVIELGVSMAFTFNWQCISSLTVYTLL